MDTHTNSNQMHPRELSLELLRSIREIDCRLNELKLYKNNLNEFITDQAEQKNYLVSRMERLIETRFCLVYSFLDLNPKIKNEFSKEEKVESTNPFENLEITYEDLRRKL